MTTKHIYISSSCGARENPEPELPLELNPEQLTPRIIEKAIQEFRLGTTSARTLLKTAVKQLPEDSKKIPLELLAEIELLYAIATRDLTPEESLEIETLKMSKLFQGEIL